MSISFFDYITASGRYPEREKHPELTSEVITNVVKLLEKVNNLLKELGIAKVTVSSGFRPTAVNNAIANAAKKSNHTIGAAVDIADPTQELSKKITRDLLIKYDLYMENPEFTKTWCHLQTTKTKSGIRVFKP